MNVNAATLYFSVGTVQTLSGVPVTTHDVVAFDGTTFSVLLDGEDVGLDSSSENIDALAVLPNGHVLLSTTGSFSVPGLSGKDEDVFEFTPSLLGATSSGAWSMPVRSPLESCSFRIAPISSRQGCFAAGSP